MATIIKVVTDSLIHWNTQTKDPLPDAVLILALIFSNNQVYVDCIVNSDEAGESGWEERIEKDISLKKSEMQDNLW